MKKFLIVCLGVAFYVVSSCAQETPPENTLVIRTQSGRTYEFSIEIAATQEEKERGLMNRKSLNPQSGMLFTFDGSERPLAFWMKNTLIPLDIIYIRKNGAIRHIHPLARPLDETPIPSNGPVAAVLEINGGEAAKLGLAPGDIVHHKTFGNELAE